MLGADVDLALDFLINRCSIPQEGLRNCAAFDDVHVQVQVEVQVQVWVCRGGECYRE